MAIRKRTCTNLKGKAINFLGVNISLCGENEGKCRIFTASPFSSYFVFQCFYIKYEKREKSINFLRHLEKQLQISSQFKLKKNLRALALKSRKKTRRLEKLFQHSILLNALQNACNKLKLKESNERTQKKS